MYVTFDLASMNLTPRYETDRMMLGSLEIFTVDFCKFNKQVGGHVILNYNKIPTLHFV